MFCMSSLCVRDTSYDVEVVSLYLASTLMYVAGFPDVVKKIGPLSKVVLLGRRCHLVSTFWYLSKSCCDIKGEVQSRDFT